MFSVYDSLISPSSRNGCEVLLQHESFISPRTRSSSSVEPPGIFHEHWDPPSLVHNLESSLVLLDKLDLIDVPPTEIHMCTMSLFNFSIARMSSIQFSCWIYRGVTINKALTFKLANEVECAALNHTGPRYPVRQLSKTQGEGEDISPWIKEESWNFLCTVWCLKAVMQRLIH